jgi:hypothetical protein
MMEPSETPAAAPAPEISCRHEYVRIFQRRLKGLDRRLVATKAYLPVGFKVGDFGHLSEGSYCFCTKCRKRLFPKRSQQEKDLARIERQRAKQAGIAAEFAAAAAEEDEDVLDFQPARVAAGSADFDEFEEKAVEEFDDDREKVEDDFASDEDKLTVELQVDELEVESVDVEDIKAEGVVLAADDDDESCVLDEDIES